MSKRSTILRAKELRVSIISTIIRAQCRPWQFGASDASEVRRHILARDAGPKRGKMVNRSGRYAAWGHPDTCAHALCDDGIRRTIRLREAADTYFSWGGRTSIGGKTVRGFVSVCEINGAGDFYFHQYKGTK